MTEEPFTGFKGEHVEMPARNVIPKPLQKPAPAGLGGLHPAVLGADGRPEGHRRTEFRLHRARALKDRVDGYYKEFEEKGAPVTPAINPNILAIGGDLSMMVAKTDERGRSSGSASVAGSSRSASCTTT